jgi:hypothetical protein
LAGKTVRLHIHVAKQGNVEPRLFALNLSDMRMITDKQEDSPE